MPTIGPTCNSKQKSSKKLPQLRSAIPCFKLFMSAWEDLGEDYPHLKSWTEIGLRRATTYYSYMNNTTIYIIVMHKLCFISYEEKPDKLHGSYWACYLDDLINDHWNTEYIRNAESTVLNMVSMNLPILVYTNLKLVDAPLSWNVSTNLV